MTVTVEDVSTNLGRTVPPSDSIAYKQVDGWITRAEQLLNWGLKERGIDRLSVDPERYDFVVLEAVSLRAKNPDASTQVDVAVDDGRVSRRYEKSTGQITFLDEWWDLLRPSAEVDVTVSTGGLYMVPLGLPYGVAP